MTNTSPTPQTFEKLVRDFNGNYKDLIGDMGRTGLAPGEEVDVTENVEVYISEETNFTNKTEVIMY